MASTSRKEDRFVLGSRRRVNRIRPTLFAVAIGAGVLGASTTARAQTFGYNDRRPFETTQNFGFELRFGPYVAAVDSEFSNAHPYQDIFGAPPNFNTQLPRVMASMQFEWQAVRLGPVAQLGLGVSLGYTSIVEKAPFTEMMTGAPSMWARGSEETGLFIVPTTAHLVLRFDGLARHNRWIPLVPYVKAGLAYDFWWITNGSGVAHQTITNADGSTMRQDIAGGSLGWHAALGLSLMLDTFEPRLARGWDQQQGVNHSYVFFEYYFTDLAGFGRPQLNVGNFSTASGTNTPVGSWVLGLMLEF
jgi:hypothetical protein